MTGGLEVSGVAPVIAGLSPNVGPREGGIRVVINGTGFAAGAAVRIGGMPALVGLVTDGTIEMTTPAGSAGWQEVVVLNPDGSEAHLAAGYRYEGASIQQPAAGGLPAASTLPPVADMSSGSGCQLNPGRTPVHPLAGALALLLLVLVARRRAGILRTACEVPPSES